MKKILLGHVYSHHFMVYAIFKVLVPGCFTGKSLEAVQVKVLMVSIATIAAPK